MGASSSSVMRIENGPDAHRNGLSENFFGIRWLDHFPIHLGENIQVLPSDLTTYLSFLEGQSRGDKGLENGFLSEPFDETKRRYYLSNVDLFAFKEGERTIGVFSGNVLDWSTYYFRYVLLAREFNGQGFYKTFLAHLSNVLKISGVNRIEAHVPPSNTKSLHVLNSLGFVITGTCFSERWGSLVQATCFLTSNNRDVFSRRLCLNIEPGNLSASP